MWRNQLLLLLFFILWTIGGFAQGIRFEERNPWKHIVRKAGKAGQLIFVDCYTSWCGPCKVLSATVFTQDTVGEFFNSHFINAKFDVEKETDGQMLRKKYQVESFPTLLFIDPATQKEVHRIVGLVTAANLLQEAAIAIDPLYNLAGLAKRYEAGEQSPGLLLCYQQALEKAMLPLNRKIAREYLDSLSLDQLATEGNWNLIMNYVDDPLSKPLRLVMAHRERFYAIAGKGAVDYKLQYTLNNAVKQLLIQSDDFNDQLYVGLTNYLKLVDDANAPVQLAYLYAYECERTGNFLELLKNMREVVKYNLFRKSSGREYFNRFLPVFQQCKDKLVIKEVIGLIVEKCFTASSWYEKADLMKQKAVLQNLLGETAGAAQSMAEEQKYRQQGDEAGEWM